MKHACHVGLVCRSLSVIVFVIQRSTTATHFSTHATLAFSAVRGARRMLHATFSTATSILRAAA